MATWEHPAHVRHGFQLEMDFQFSTEVALVVGLGSCSSCLKLSNVQATTTRPDLSSTRRGFGCTIVLRNEP